MPGIDIDRDVALRVGLASRTLPECDPALMWRILGELVALPPTTETLDGITLRRLRAVVNRELRGVPDTTVRETLEVLHGLSEVAEHDPAPQPERAADAAQPNGVRVACASNGGERIDGHFGSCPRFLVYEVSADESRLVDVREAHVSKQRVDLVGDCKILFTASIGGPAVARVIRAGVHPVKVVGGVVAPDYLLELQRVVAEGGRRWLDA